MVGMFRHFIRHPDGQLEECDDIEKYAAWFETADRLIDRNAVPYGPDNKKAVMVSTTFLGMDRGFAEIPVLFETVTKGMPDGTVFGGLTSTEDQARAQHKKTLHDVEKILRELQALDGFSDGFKSLVKGEPQKIPPPKPRALPLPNNPPLATCNRCKGLGKVVNSFGLWVVCDCTL